MFKSLYPSLMNEFNIAPNTQIGKIEIDHKVYDGENAYNISAEQYSRGGEFIENLVTDNFIDYCHRWFKLGNIQEMIEDIDEYFDRYKLGTFSNLISAGYGTNGKSSPILPGGKKVQEPLVFNKPKNYVPLIFHTRRDEKYTYYNLIEESKEMP